MLRPFVLACALAAAVAPAAGYAQSNYPSKPVRLIVPFAPGGATDVVARQLAQKLGELWGQSVIVENRAGAGGNIGADAVAKAPADGYTLLMTSGSIVTANQHLYRNLPFDPAKDLVPITNVASGPQVVAVHPAVPAQNLLELVAFTRKNPGALSFGSAGVGTQTHLAGENLAAAAGLDAVHIPYKGEAPALTDLIAGQIQLATPNLAAAIGYIQQGKLRALAVTSAQRVAQLPNVPTVAESVPGFENVGWFGLMAPAGTPGEVIDKIYADTAHILDTTEMKARLYVLGMAPVGNRPADFARAIRAESGRWAEVIRKRKIAVN